MNWGYLKKEILPGDGYSKEYKDDVLCAIEKDFDWTSLPEAFTFLLTKSNGEKARIAEVLHNCVAKLTNSEMVKLDAIFRERTSIDWHYDWKNACPSNLLLANMSVEAKVSILGLCTLHPNGFYREKALQTLGSFETGREISFFLLRCNDWVQEVGSTAKLHVEQSLTIKNAYAIVQNLPIVFKLEKSKRADHSEIVEKIIELLSQKEAIPFLDQGSQSISSHVRFFCYRIMISSKMFDKNSLLSYFKKEKEPHSRLILFREILNDIKMEEFDELYPLLAHDTFPKIRLDVLEKYYLFYQEKSLPVLENALLDKSGSIRSIARHLLKKLNVSNFSSYYEKVITDGSNVNRKGALLGLGEVGNKDHIPLILPFLDDDKVGTIKAAIRSVLLLDGNNHKKEFMNLLNHQHSGVSKEAARALRFTHYQQDEVFSTYLNAKYSHTRYNAAVLLCSLPKWESLPYIIIFYVNTEDNAISQLGKLQLTKWLDTFNRTFQSPTKGQIECIRQCIMEHGHELLKEERVKIEFLLRG
ncbi:hypothetical protein DS745_23045 [Anaerobacillus alkaliphilus]|uniref:HEAT repeat domain-containing protein n=1 Tax=Anaerobacillus alkaliphilus TaxID=1548597 RepID=A0A4Q0VN65_9BACI|nr:hypothetical protein [Anaerobacillus alkaliphilus]RXI96583.1 hypothetical protein DS745_23045 [Anaerobacillus alkaliphilus]